MITFHEKKLLIEMSGFRLPYFKKTNYSNILSFYTGCLKNLMLRILRGSYPNIPTKYSLDLKNLIHGMLKKNPLDRPSLNVILRKKFIHKVETEMNRPKAFQPVQQIRNTQTKRAEKLYNRKSSKPRRTAE